MLLSHKRGAEYFTQYWLLLELLCSEFDKDTTVFKISEARLMSALRIKYARKLHSFIEVLVKFCESFDKDLVKFTVNSDQTLGKFYVIETPIMLELIGKEFKRTRQRRGRNAAKKKEERIKNKETTTTTTKSDYNAALKEIVELYNKIAEMHNLEKVDLSNRNMTRFNEKLMIDFARSYQEIPDIDFWKKAVTGILSDSFYYSGNNETAWRVNFSYLIKIDKAQKLYNSYNTNLENIHHDYRIQNEI